MNCENLGTIILYLTFVEKKNLKDLLQVLIDFNKKAEEFDKLLIDLRIEINNALWDLMELRKGKEKRVE